MTKRKLRKVITKVEFFMMIETIRGLRTSKNLNFGEALQLIANEFGFPQRDNNPLSGWRNFSKWRNDNQIDFSNIKGPHTYTLLKMFAARLGRSPSTGQ